MPILSLLDDSQPALPLCTSNLDPKAPSFCDSTTAASHRDSEPSKLARAKPLTAVAPEPWPQQPETDLSPEAFPKPSQTDVRVESTSEPVQDSSGPEDALENNRPIQAKTGRGGLQSYRRPPGPHVEDGADIC